MCRRFAKAPSTRGTSFVAPGPCLCVAEGRQAAITAISPCVLRGQFRFHTRKGRSNELTPMASCS